MTAPSPAHRFNMVWLGEIFVEPGALEQGVPVGGDHQAVANMSQHRHVAHLARHTRQPHRHSVLAKAELITDMWLLNGLSHDMDLAFDDMYG